MSHAEPEGQMEPLSPSPSYADSHMIGMPGPSAPPWIRASTLFFITAHRPTDPVGKGMRGLCVGLVCNEGKHTEAVGREGISVLTEEGPSSPEGEAPALYAHTESMGAITPAWIPIDRTVCLSLGNPCLV